MVSAVRTTELAEIGGWVAERLPGGTTIDSAFGRAGLPAASSSEGGSSRTQARGTDGRTRHQAVISAQARPLSRPFGAAIIMGPAAELKPPPVPKSCSTELLEDESRQICVAGEIADVVLDILGVDRDALAVAVRRGEADLVEDPLHHRLQAPRADVLDAGIDRHREARRSRRWRRR